MNQASNMPPDAELLRLLQDVEHADAESTRLGVLWDSLNSSDLAYEKARKEAEQADAHLIHLVHRACSIRASSLIGWSAKARMMHRFNSAIQKDGTLSARDIYTMWSHSLSIDLAGPPFSVR